MIAAENMSSEEPYKQYGFSLDRQTAEYTAEAYFLVVEAYREKRQHDGHRLQPQKIAAITSAVINTLNPLRPLLPPETADTVTTYANPLFALRICCDIVDHPIHRRPWFQRMWFCDNLRTLDLHCLRGYVEDVRIGSRTLGSNFELSLSQDELGRLEGKFGFFQVLSEMPIFLREPIHE